MLVVKDYIMFMVTNLLLKIVEYNERKKGRLVKVLIGQSHTGKLTIFTMKSLLSRKVFILFYHCKFCFENGERGYLN